ncbi:hypothetical protein QYE80_08085 [Pseudomonas tohonis]|nr:hypothetical protein L682_27330 [Pseudomonas alcaligenes OT 69]MDN4144933.1 hypothetical protein [Pseudomonas tohonis]
MTLAQERARIGAGISSSRASTLKRDLNSLEASRRKVQELNSLERKGARPATRGRGLWVEPKATGGTGGGVAWPLTEQTKVVDGKTVPDREYYEDLVLVTSDGFFTFEVPPFKSTKWTDADGTPDRQFIYADGPRP